MTMKTTSPAKRLYFDEKLGRNMAEYMGFQVTGTPGVLAKARTQGLIPSFREAAYAMRAQGIFFNEALIARIALQIGEPG